MLYNYEAAILNYIRGVVPGINQATYAKDFDIMKAMAKSVKYPAFYYFRELTDWDFNVIYKFTDTVGIITEACPFSQTYVGKIYVESTQSSQDIAEKLRFYWNKNPYVLLRVGDDDIKVSLRLLYIKIDEERPIHDEKGAQRYVEFKWNSRLLAINSVATRTHLVEEVRIYIDEDGNTNIETKNLTKVIK